MAPTTVAATPATATGSSNTFVTASVSGLSPATTYYFRPYGVAGGLTVYGSTFVATTQAANTAPTDIVCAGLYAAPSIANSLVCALSTVDADLSWQTFTYTVTGGANAASFSINGSNQLVLTAAGLTASTLAVAVQTTDSGVPPLSFTKTITVYRGEGGWSVRTTAVCLNRRCCFTVDTVSSGSACVYSDQCANIATEFCRVGDLRCFTASACGAANTADTTNRDCTTVARLNNAPTALVLSQSKYVPPVSAAQAVGTLSTTDADSGTQTFTYSVVGGAQAARFALSSNQLQFATASTASGSLVVVVRTVDSGIPTRFLEQNFTVTRASFSAPTFPESKVRSCRALTIAPLLPARTLSTERDFAVGLLHQPGGRPADHGDRCRHAEHDSRRGGIRAGHTQVLRHHPTDGSDWGEHRQCLHQCHQCGADVWCGVGHHRCVRAVHAVVDRSGVCGRQLDCHW